MNNISKKVNKILKEKNISNKKLSDLLKKNKGYISHVLRGDRPFSDNVIRKLLPILEVSKEEFEGWIVADKYSKEILQLAIEEKKAFPYKRKSILTAKIDKILEEKGMSRTILAKHIGYSQSGLNRMIVGKINMSRPVMEKVSNVLEIPQEKITGWIVADKYNLKILEIAFKAKSQRD